MSIGQMIYNIVEIVKFCKKFYGPNGLQEMTVVIRTLQNENVSKSSEIMKALS